MDAIGFNADSSAIKVWPAEGLEKVQHCPVCKSLERERLYKGLTDQIFRCAPGYWDVYRCKCCRSAYLDPRPTPSTILMAYQSYYTHKRPKRQNVEESTLLQRLKLALVNGYLNRRYNGELQPASWLGRLVLPALPKYRQALDRELRYLPPLKPGGRVLDVGFGSGAFLLIAQEIGWRVFGADPDLVAVTNAHEAGLNVRQGGINAFADEREQFDVITMSHVIEHAHDPIQMLNDAYALLKPGGVLYIDTPNIDAFGHHKFNKHWRGLEIPRHLVLFNWESITELLNKTGFTDSISVPSARPYVRLASTSRAIQNGQDPYTMPRPRLVDAFVGLRLSLSLLKNKQNSEFITMIAKK